jgi:hypothetical protein
VLAKLMAVVRPEFRAEVYVPAPNDPVFVSDQCIVADCDRTAETLAQRLCCAHSQRFRKRGYSSMEEFLADPGGPTRGRRAPRSLRRDGMPARSLGPIRVVPQAQRLLEAFRAA